MQISVFVLIIPGTSEPLLRYKYFSVEAMTPYKPKIRRSLAARQVQVGGSVSFRTESPCELVDHVELSCSIPG